MMGTDDQSVFEAADSVREVQDSRPSGAPVTVSKPTSSSVFDDAKAVVEPIEETRKRHAAARGMIRGVTIVVFVLIGGMFLIDAFYFQNSDASHAAWDRVISVLALISAGAFGQWLFRDT
ncbi:MAG: hypothetical protein QM784_30520 [Polyangiaceae bacterium]